MFRLMKCPKPPRTLSTTSLKNDVGKLLLNVDCVKATCFMCRSKMRMSRFKQSRSAWFRVLGVRWKMDGPRPADLGYTPGSRRPPAAGSPRGIVLQNLTPGIRQPFGIASDVHPGVVTNAHPDTP